MVEELKDVTDSLELVPVTDLEIGFTLKAAEIEIQGKEVLEQALESYKKKYTGYIVTEETLSDDIKVKDELGRVQRQIEQELKNQLSEYSKPLDEAKAWVESILDPIKTLQTDIKNQIREFEERETEARKETVREALNLQSQKVVQNLTSNYLLFTLTISARRSVLWPIMCESIKLLLR